MRCLCISNPSHPPRVPKKFLQAVLVVCQARLNRRTRVYDGIMTKAAGWGWVLLAGVLGTVAVFADTLNNQNLKGNYYFRHVSLGTDGVNPGNLTDARSLIGSISFDGSGNYSFTGQQLTGINAATSQTGKGTYSLDPGGFLSLDSPLRTGAKINARFGTEAIIGSSTESSDNTYDLFVAIPAPASGAIFSGPYNCMSLEFPGGSTANMRSTQFQLNQSALVTLQQFSVSGHAASISLGRPVTQQMPAGAATYTLGGNRQRSLSGGAANNPQLLSGSRILYLSASGNILLGGSTAAGGHDILIGVKPVSGGTNASWNATFWGAGLRVDATSVSGYSGALSAAGKGKLTWSKRFKALGAGAFD